jgi:site-specific DNA-methyltransferase (adenine-specific)
MSIELHCMDALEFIATLPDKSVDAIITDLPYGTTACSWDVIIPFEPMWKQVKRINKGVFVTTASQPFTSKLVMSNLDNFKEEAIWEKERPSNIFLMHKKLGKVHENILIFYDGVFNPQLTPSGKNRTRDTMQKYVGNKLKHQDGQSVTSYRSDWDGSKCLPRSVSYFVRDSDADNHPTQKPVALYEYLIRTYTNEGDTVLDFTCGSGTTGVACVNTNRNCILNDNDAGYIEIARKRISDAQQQMRLGI